MTSKKVHIYCIATIVLTITIQNVLNAYLNNAVIIYLAVIIILNILLTNYFGFVVSLYWRLLLHTFYNVFGIRRMTKIKPRVETGT
jgi:hypothetical protein